MASSVSSISVRGTIRNFGFESGFTAPQLLSELIDDSIGASSKCIRILMEKKGNDYKGIISDSGTGMEIETLDNAHILNNDSKSSEQKQGRFGAGRKHALIGLSDKTTVKTLTRYTEQHTDDYSGVLELDIDFRKSIETNIYNPQSHHASALGEKKYEKYAINPRKTGTCTIITLFKDRFDDIVRGIKSKNIQNSILYKFAYTYPMSHLQGLSIEFVIDIDNIITHHTLLTFDRLMWNEISPLYRTETEIRMITSADSPPRFIYKKNDGKWYERPATANLNAHCNMVEYKQSECDSQIIFRGTFSNDWTKICEPIIKQIIGDDLIPCKKTCSDDDYGIKEDNDKFQNGTTIKRNNKVLAHYPPKMKSTGDFSVRKFTDQPRYELSFSANMLIDNAFGVRVNKSDLPENGIDSNLQKTYTYLKYMFTKQLLETASKPTSTPKNSIPVTAKAETLTIKKSSKGTTSKQNALLVPTATPTLNTTAAPTLKPTAAPTLKPTAAPTVDPLLATQVIPVLEVKTPNTTIDPITHHPTLNIEFSKTDTDLIISENKIKIKIPYVGQYHLTEKYYSEMRNKMGEKRFMEWIIESDRIGVFKLNRRYYTV